MKAHLITVGDEILIGQIVDTNSAWMARQLNLAGASVAGISSVGDELPAIEAAMRAAFASADVVLMTGGLGPTKDDITKKAIANFFGVEMVFHSGTYERILRIFGRLGRPATEAHRQQAFMPENADLLYNKMGSAPGMWFEWKGKVLVSMPGVPYEMKYLMEHQVLPRLKDHFPGRPIAHRTILTVGEGESRIAERIAAFEDGLPPGLKLAYLPGLGQVRLRLTGTGDDESLLRRTLDGKCEELAALLSDVVFGRENQKLEEVIGQMLREHQLRLATAESCTGGYLAHRITSIPGSSDYFTGSVIAYANEVKEKLLGVRSETLEAHGAVSRETVIEMVEGTLRLLGTDLAVAISGIAGPGGGTPEKPVGTIWMAIGNQHAIAVKKIQAGRDRLKNIEYSTIHALNMVRLFVLENY